MGIYAYCVVPIGHAPGADLRGVSEAAVEIIDAGPVALWVSRMPRPDGTVEQIKAHNTIVEAAVTNEVTPVPLRFGQWVEDEGALVAGMVEQGPSYAEKLRMFAGCMEFGIRVIDPAQPQGAQDVHPERPASGTAYMQALRETSRMAGARQAVADQVRGTIQQKAGVLVKAEQEEESRTPHAVVTLSHLVPRENFDEYRERVRELREEFPALRLLLSGPWPPYSFAI